MNTIIKMMNEKGITLEKHATGTYRATIGFELVERLTGSKKVERFHQFAKDGSRYFYTNTKTNERFEGSLNEMKEYIVKNF